MRQTFYCALVFISTLVHGQEQPNDLPDFTPPSPEAHAITKYGNQTINESTGRVSSSIPIHNFQAGQLEMPISLNYTGNGVKLDDNNTWTGVNWVLNAGGVITRTVYHKPDELSSQRVFKDDIEALGLVNADDDAVEFNQFFNSTGNQWDTQPDIFTFSFGGYSGSFYLSDYNSNQFDDDPSNDAIPNFTPTLINVESDLKIEIDGPLSDNQNNLVQHKKFKITTTDGVVYHFGGAMTEETSMEQDYHSVVTPQAVTSFYLTQIVHPIHGSIILEYDNVLSYRIATSQSKEIKRYAYGVGFYDGCGMPKFLCEPVEGEDTQHTSSIILNKVMNGKFLKRIYTNSNSQEIIFNSSTPGDSGFNFERVLNNIEIKQAGSLVTRVELEYLTDYENNEAQRFFLERVAFRKSNTSSDQDLAYAFEYNDPLDLPARFSTSQDALGYYNGKSNPDGLLPDLSDLPPGYGGPQHVLAGSGIIATADRSTDLNFKQKGALAKIYYPTGGHTLFEYEGEQAKETTLRHVDRKVYRNDYPVGNGTTHNNILSNGIYIGSLGGANGVDENGNPIQENYSLFESQYIDIHVEIESISQVYNQDWAVIRVRNVLDNTIELEQSIAMTIETDFDPVFFEQRTISHFFDKNKEYIIELSLPNNSGGPPMKGIVYLDYRTGYQLVDGEGLRVKRTSDFTSDGSSAPTNIKRYYYTGVQNVLKNPIEYVDVYKKPIFYKKVNLLKKCSSWDETPILCDPEIGSDGEFIWIRTPFTGSIDSHPGYTLGIHPTNYNEQVINNFEVVTISYGGDHFENGGLEKRFIKDISNVVMEVHPPKIHTIAYVGTTQSHRGAGWLNLLHGKQIKEIVLKKENDTLFKIKESKQTYLARTLSYQQSFVGSIFNDFGPGPLFPYENVGLGRYEIRSKEIALSSSTDIDYIDPFPVTWTGDISHHQNPYAYQGWEGDDHDNDGIINSEDLDYWALLNNYDPLAVLDESTFRKITINTNNEYSSSYPGQPTKTIMTTSTDGRTVGTELKYVDEAASIGSGNELINYQALEGMHRVATPILSTSFAEESGVFTTLSKSKTVYDDFNGKLLPSSVYSAKGNDSLEERVVFENYDGLGNLTEVKLVNGSITRYEYNAYNQVIRKIENYVPPTISLPSSPNLPDYCQLMSQAFPNSLVTEYFYDPVTNLMTYIIDARCNKVYYEYDEQLRLKYVKDKNGNILSKNEYNYAIQN
ncbi:RHS repeat protein [Aureisphaera galaxeae]|uniref:RHS repeat domain-containing protein n=1 Tax=Aureisphaera galaxeae TaxID=1538023 RepID=UPI002350B364|nr:RHS repeat domain-containing protein [Aureisphaera galaxeae]MDC8006366.1 RHS repeat protein [Aureisphaera galaxeae]